MSESVKNFWEKAHNENISLWLTGSGFNEVWKYLNILNLLSPNNNILNIGVGLGGETRELIKRNVIIDVLDISETALERVKNITRNQYLSSNINNLPINEYDIVVSHLVTQHMDNNGLNEQIKYVLRSLKSEGVFAMQFAFIDNDQDTLIKLGKVYHHLSDVDVQLKGFMFRTLSEMNKIVEDNGGHISWISEERKFDKTPIKWYYIHIKNKIYNEK